MKGMTMLFGALVAAFAACGEGSSGREAVDAAPRRDAGFSECEFAGSAGTADGDCWAMWLCNGRNPLTLSCAAMSSGVECACLERGSEPVPVDGVPPDCIDPATLAAFVAAQCGWEAVQ